MTEILTESFCERCGTRYTFEAVEERRKPLRSIGTLGRSLRHFVSDPGSSLEEAYAVAKSEQEQVSTSHALEAFHRTFNFCLNCRQYTCADCWNAVEGRCLTCAPNGGAATPETRQDTAVRLSAADLAPTSSQVLAEPFAPASNGTNGTGATHDELPPSLEPIDLAVARAEARAQAEAEDHAEAGARAAALAKAEAAAAEEWERITAEAAAAEEAERRAEEARVAAEAAEAAAIQAQAEADARAAEEAEAEARAAAQAAADAAARAADEARAVAAAEQERAAAEARAVAEARAASDAADAEAKSAADRARAFMFEPGKNLDDAIAAYEASLSPDAAQPEASEQVAADEEVAAVEQEAVEPEAAFEPEPVSAAADVVGEPEPVLAAPTAAAESEAAPAAVAAVERATEAVSEPAIEAEPEPVAAVAAEQPPVIPFEPVAPSIDELPVAASAEAPPVRSEPIPTAVGQPIPANVVDGPLAWPEPGAAAALFEPAWPDTPVPRRRVASVPAPRQAAMPAPAHSCPGCGLSLSASARFCRRCGSPQQVDAVR